MLRSFHPSLGLVDHREQKGVLAAAPDREAGGGARLEDAVGLADLALGVVDKHEHQIGNIAVEPVVGEGQVRAARFAPVD